jgi:hypothetical protein
MPDPTGRVATSAVGWPLGRLTVKRVSVAALIAVVVG